MQPSGTFKSSGIELTFFESKPETKEEKQNETIVLVHGFASHSHMNWINTNWFSHLSEAGYHVISFDNRGHGQSETLYDVEKYGADLMAGDVKALLQHIGIEKAHIMGYSMGARISAFVARDYPEILKSVIFAGMGLNMVRGMGNPEPIARALEAKSSADVTNPAAQSFRQFAEQTKSDLKALAACIRSARNPVTKEQLQQIAVPCLVAVGEKDVIAGAGSALVELIPGAEHLPIPKRDHMNAVGDKVYKEGVVKFLKSISPR